jgi:hypothetical protein
VAVTGCESHVETERLRRFSDELLREPCDPHMIASLIDALLLEEAA